MKEEDIETVEIAEEQQFNSGDIIVNEDFTVIGIFCEELTDKDEQITFPAFYIACSNGQVHENFDDLECYDWPGEYRFATDEEVEIFLKEIEDMTNYVWNPNTKMLEIRDKGGDWKVPNHFYPTTWDEAADNYTACNDLENTLVNCACDEEYSGVIYSFAQLKLLYDIYSHGNKNIVGEVSYAVVVTPEGEIDCRPYIYGIRNSLLSFRYHEQAVMFMTYFEKLIKKCGKLV